MRAMTEAGSPRFVRFHDMLLYLGMRLDPQGRAIIGLFEWLGETRHPDTGTHYGEKLAQLARQHR